MEEVDELALPTAEPMRQVKPIAVPRTACDVDDLKRRSWKYNANRGCAWEVEFIYQLFDSW
jgi:hypothetical protein